MDNTGAISAWFAGPKAENGEAFQGLIARVLQDYYSWRRNYFPEDAVVLDSAQRRANEPFLDAFEDRLTELLGRLKADFPFQSPRYAGHMIAEQTLPSIAGWFAAMLYNPNNVTADSAPVTVRLEHEASALIARMLGYSEDCWAHLTSGGTIANIEALWIARSVAVLPWVVEEMRQELGLLETPAGESPLEDFRKCAIDADRVFGASDSTNRRVISSYLQAPSNVAEQGIGAVCRLRGWQPVVFAPETHHYCLLKALDALGLGRQALRRVRVDSDFRMDMCDLRIKLDEARKAGESPMAVIAVAGTTEEGAIDPIDQILEVRKNTPFWFHVDAAYGGYLRTVTIPGRVGLGEPKTQSMAAGKLIDLDLRLPEKSACRALERLGEADSIAIDPHKLGYVPYPAGAVCYKSNLVKPIARQEAPYLEDSASGIEAEAKSKGIGVYILEGSKPGAAAAAVWLSHTLIPLDSSGHGKLIRMSIRNATEFYELLEGYERLVPGQTARAITLCPPGSNIVCYAFRPSESSPGLKSINALNRALYKRFTVGSEGSSLVYGQRFFVSRTTLSASQYSPSTVSSFLARLEVDPLEYERDGIFLLRSVLMNPWYEESKVRGRYVLSELVDELYHAAGELVQG